MLAQTNTYANTNDLISRPRLDIEALVKLKLPPMKGTVLKIMDLLRDPNVSNKKLGDAISYDPILTARILRLANSTMYSNQKSVTSIPKALDSIGTRALYDIVILDAMAEGFGKEIRNSVLMRSIWEHSIAVGLLSRQLVKVIGLQGGEEAFVCGLLHDIGKILMLRTDVDRFETLLDRKSQNDMLEWEQQLFGFDHMEVGAYVGNKWRLPDTVCSVIMHHHQPSRSSISLVTAHIVNAADLTANTFGYGLRVEEETSLLISESVALLKLDQQKLHAAWESIKGEMDEVLAIL